jgi:hypothetical protein
MGTIILILIVAFFTIIIDRMIGKKREKEVTVVVMSTDEAQAKRLFESNVGGEMPPDFIKVKQQPTCTTFSFVLKK